MINQDECLLKKIKKKKNKNISPFRFKIKWGQGIKIQHFFFGGDFPKKISSGRITEVCQLSPPVTFTFSLPVKPVTNFEWWKQTQSRSWALSTRITIIHPTSMATFLSFPSCPKHWHLWPDWVWGVRPASHSLPHWCSSTHTGWDGCKQLIQLQTLAILPCPAWFHSDTGFVLRPFHP